MARGIVRAGPTQLSCRRGWFMQATPVTPGGVGVQHGANGIRICRARFEGMSSGFNKEDHKLYA